MSQLVKHHHFRNQDGCASGSSSPSLCLPPRVSMCLWMLPVSPVLPCDTTQYRITQNKCHSSAYTGEHSAGVCFCGSEAVIPSMTCCDRPSHGQVMVWYGLSQSVSRDLSPISPVGTLGGWVYKLGCKCGFGMHRWACIIATQWMHTSDGETCREP